MTAESKSVEFGFDIKARASWAPQILQVHGNRSVEITAQQTKSLPEADGLFTFDVNCTLKVSSADCVPILFFTSDRRGPVAAVHAGWRGAVAGVVPQLLQQLGHWPASQMTAVIGPSIGPCCFEVREDLINAFLCRDPAAREFVTERHGALYFDLPGWIGARELMLPGAMLSVDFSHFKCTACCSELPSFRRDKKTDPSLVSWIRKV